MGMRLLQSWKPPILTLLKLTIQKDKLRSQILLVLRFIQFKQFWSSVSKKS